jgi:chromosome segregation ATPase
MSDTGIAEQIATLRAQIADTEAEIESHQARRKAEGREGGDAEAPEAELVELKEAHEFMLNRLSRLESCRRALDP